MTVNVTSPTFTLPIRAAVPVFGATVKPIDPLPLPLVVVSVIQGTRLFAVHGHPAFVVTPMVPGPPAAGIDVDDCCSEIVHEGAGGGGGVPAAVGSCVIPIVTPPTVIVPVRSAPGLGAIVKVTLALPAPDGSDTAIQFTLLAAVHAHPAGAEIVIVPAPPDGGNWPALAATTSSHAAALWRTSARCPLITMAVSRAMPLGFGTA